jgi:hypothetical protein
LTRERITDRWIAAATRQLKESDPRVVQSALLHALALDARDPAPEGTRASVGDVTPVKTVVLAGDDAPLQTALTQAGFAVRRVVATPFDAEAAEKINHFETYNRTHASQRVADIVRAIGDSNATVIAAGDWGPATLLALALRPVNRAIVDVAKFDNSSDQMFVDHLYIPGIRRAGDLQTAISMTKGIVVIHNAGERFTLNGARVERRSLTPKEIVELVPR